MTAVKKPRRGTKKADRRQTPTVLQFSARRKLPDDFDLNRVPLKHPETGAKIYLLSAWNAGFWFRKSPGRGDGQMWPCQYGGDLRALRVHPDAFKEVK